MPAGASVRSGAALNIQSQCQVVTLVEVMRITGNLNSSYIHTIIENFFVFFKFPKASKMALPPFPSRPSISFIFFSPLYLKTLVDKFGMDV